MRQNVFLSYSTSDHAACQRISERLTERGLAPLFRADHTEHGIQPGSNWRQELRDALAECQAVVHVISAESAESKWCFAEVLLAQLMGKPVFPIRIRFMLITSFWVQMFQPVSRKAKPRLNAHIMKLIPPD